MFVANDGINGSEPWVTDGTPSGTVMLKNISPSGSSNPTGLAAFAGYVLFRADDGVNGPQLWLSDGTATGTAMLKNIYPGASPSQVVVAGCQAFFAAKDDAGTELWR